MMKYVAFAAAIAVSGAAYAAGHTPDQNADWAQTISSTFKGGPNSAHGQTYGSVNKLINDAIRETGSYTTVHPPITTYTQPGAGNRR